MNSLTIGIIGRTEMLLSAAREVLKRGHRIGFVATCHASGHELASRDDFAGLASESGVPFLYGKELTQEDGIAAVRSTKCDIAISMNWLHLLPASLLETFPSGVFNAHPGDLPRYRGNACPNWAILQDEQQVVLTIHKMVEELDAGPVALKRGFDLRPARSIGDVYVWLREAVPNAFGILADTIASNALVLTPQPSDPAFALRCYPRRPADGRVVWSRSVIEIDRLIRASGRPFAGAFTSLEGGEIVRIWAATPFSNREAFLAVPGQVVFSHNGDPIIAASDGFLKLTDVTFDDSEKPQDAKAAILKSLRNRLI